MCGLSDPHKHGSRYRMDGGVADTTCYTQAVNRQKVGGGNQLTIVSKPKHGAMLGV